MFKRLLKHHLKSTWKEFNISFATIIILGLFLALAIRSRNEVFIIITGITFYASFIALTILLVNFHIKLFYSTTYGKQGYLTFTLPISTHALIISKIVAVLLYSIGFAISIILSLVMFLLVLEPEVLKEIAPALLEMSTLFTKAPGATILFTFYGIIATLSTYVMIQFACAFANTSTSSKSKVGLVILILWGIGVATSIIASFDPINLYFTINFETGKLGLKYMLDAALSDGAVLPLWLLILEIGKMVGFYFLTVYVIDKKIEIQ